MNVVIRETEYEYKSDHPNGWKRSKGDFKFPVAIGNNKCFIKRFNKDTKTISGWQLLQNLVDKRNGNPPVPKHEANLPRIHDIVNIKEKNENAHYVFLEFIEGETLSKLLSDHVKINLETLTEGLFSAFQSLNKYGFWFADFFEKNICSDKKGNFFLIDLDSSQPIEKAPDIDMWGEKEYWALVFDFFRQILHKQNFRPSHINGAILNYLQVIFLILRIKIFNQQKEKDYGEINISASHLNKISPSFKEIFNKAFENNDATNSKSFINEIKNLIKEKIIVERLPNPKSEPVIKKFTVNNQLEKPDGNFVVENGEVFTLNWEVKNFSDIQLYKNGQFFQKIQEGEESIELAEKVYDSDEKIIEFELIASNAGEVVSELLNVLIVRSESLISQFEVENYSEKNGDYYKVENGATYNLTWNVINAKNIKLYKNGSLFNEFTNNQNKISVSDRAYDGKTMSVEYKLLVSDNRKTDTKSLTVNVIESTAEKPVINSFGATEGAKSNGDNRYIVENGKPFKIYWNVDHATKVKLYKNGNFYKDYYGNENTFELTEKVYDGKESTTEYSLIALNDFVKTEPKSFKIDVKTTMVVEFGLSNYAKKNGTNYTVRNQKPFTLEWHVENVSDLGLLRNGKVYKTLEPDQENLEISEAVVDGKETRVEYTLVASGVSGIKREAVSIIVRKPGLNPFFLVFGFIVLGIAGSLIYSKYFKNDTIIDGKTDSTKIVSVKAIVYPSIRKNTISENDTITVFGQNLPEKQNTIQIIYNDSVNGTIIKQSKDSINALVPHLEANDVSIRLNINDTSYNVVNNVSYHKKIIDKPETNLVIVNPLAIPRINENDVLTISGENFPKKSSSVLVLFNGVRGKILSQTSRSLRVAVPSLSAGTVADIVLKIKNNFFPVARGVNYVALPVVKKKITTLNPFSQDVITEGEIITITGYNIPEEPGSVQVIFDGKVIFSIVEQTKNYIRARVPTLSLRRGILAVKVNDKNFIPLPNSLVNYKLH